MTPRGRRCGPCGYCVRPRPAAWFGRGVSEVNVLGRSPDWTLLICGRSQKPEVLERCVLKRRNADVYIVADAYRGDEICQAILDFFDAASGGSFEPIRVSVASAAACLSARGGAELVAYVGDDGLMDFPLPIVPRKKDEIHREVVILACASQQYFSEPLRASGAYPLLWTIGLMAPEAYTLKSALEGWIEGESNEQVRQRAAIIYDKYQKCGLRGPRRLFATGW